MKKLSQIRGAFVKKNNKSKNMEAIRKRKIQKGAEDFAVRFEGVMKDLAKG